MVKTEFYMTRSDGVSLYRTYSDQGRMLIRNDGVEYGEAVDVENSGYTYIEGNYPAEDITETEAKAMADPIPYEGNMTLVAGLYYTQDGATYLCNRDTVNPVYNPLRELVGIYVEIVN